MPVRSRSTTAIQALNLLNSSFVARRADVLAQRVLHRSPDSIDEQVLHLFALAVSRPPNPTEQTAMVDVAKEHGLAAVCRAIFNSNEFLFLP